MTVDAFDRKAGGLKVCRKACDECLYSRRKIVGDDRRASLLEKCRRDGTYFICHKHTLRGQAAVCRRFFDEESNTACQVAPRHGIVVFVDEPKTGA